MTRGLQMLRRLRRPGHATVVAYLALFLALGGGAYAATQINGKNLVDRSVGAKKIKRDILTGNEVREAALGKVRSAAIADSARSVRKLDFRQEVTQDFSPPKTLQVGAMRLGATCFGGGQPQMTLRVESATGEANSVATIGFTKPGEPTDSRSAVSTFVKGHSFSATNDDFTVVNVIPASVGAPFGQADGQIIYRNDARVVTVAYHSFVLDQENDRAFCELNGTVTVT